MAVVCQSSLCLAGDLKILPLGDSITFGAGASGNPVPGGYRSKLYSDLKAANINSIYVGALAVNPSPTLTTAGQNAHCGYSGRTIIEITADIDGWMNTCNPDVVLLHIGTNDMLCNRQGGAPDRLNSLVDKITSKRPNLRLFFAGITPLTNGNAWANHHVIDYNKAVKEMVVPKYRDSLHRNVYYVDQYANFVSTGVLDPTHIPDGAHPDQTGYDFMATALAKSIIATFPQPTLKDTAGVTDSK